MSDYSKFESRLVASRNANYSNPYQDIEFPNDESEPSKVWANLMEVTTAGGAANTITVNHFTAASPAELTIHNYDKTNYVSVTVRLMGDADDAVLRVRAGKTTRVTIDPVTDIVADANGANCECLFVIEQ